jgi:chemotaxis protein histidine kinase CheA
MTDFTLDDIEETFREDMRTLLGRLGTMAAIVEAPAPAKVEEELLSRQVAFEALVAATHAIKGTAGLVGTDGLATLAGIAEELAERARDAARDARIHLERTRILSAAFLEASRAVPGVLDLELARKQLEANDLAEPIEAHGRKVLMRDDLLLAPVRGSMLVPAPPPSLRSIARVAESDSASLDSIDDGFAAIAEGRDVATPEA